MTNCVNVSKGNSKIGKIMNVNLPPVISCPKGIPCAKDCYAMKAWRQYKNVREAWGGNWELLKDNEKAYFEGIADTIQRTKKMEFFRWHSAGDIPSQSYLEGMKAIAKMFPAVKFLAFTKNSSLDFSDLPENLNIVASQWGEYTWGDDLPKAIVRAKGETWETPANAVDCAGSCKDCKVCWNLKKGQAVIFDQH